MNRCVLTGILFAVISLPAVSDDASKTARFEKTEFNIDGHSGFVILPDESNRSDDMPWVFYAPTFKGLLPSASDEGWMMERFLAKGIAIAGVDVGESYGSPYGRDVYSALHEHVVKEHGFSTQACLLARSRGGLMLYSWAADHPEHVRCIAGIYPVCDLRSYPGLDKACEAYDLTEGELREQLAKHNPVDRLVPLAKANIPILHIHGDTDKIVPLDVNSATVAQRYNQLGGTMELIVAKDQGHNMWSGFFECRELVDFVIAQATNQPNNESKADGVPVPIAYWRLDDLGDIAVDSAGNHDGRIVGAQSVEGRIETGLLFDRPKNHYVNIPYSKDFELSTFTVSAWVKLTREPTFSGILGTRFNKEHTFDMKVNTAKVHGDIGNGKEWIEIAVNFYADDTGSNSQGGDLDVGPWYHLVYVIDSAAKECRLYLDADLKKTISFQGKDDALLMQPGQEMHIGHSSNEEFMDGVIDDVRIHNRALSSRQVRQLFENSAPVR